MATIEEKRLLAKRMLAKQQLASSQAQPRPTAQQSVDIGSNEMLGEPSETTAQLTAQEINEGYLPQNAVAPAIETALTMATGATTGTIGYLKGALEGVIKTFTDEGFSPEDAAKLAMETASKHTYMPKTEVAQELIGAIGEATEWIPPVMGGAPTMPKNLVKAASAPNAARRARAIAQGKKKQDIVSIINKGEVNPAAVGYDVNKGLLIKNPLERKVVDSGFKPPVIGVVKQFTPREKRLTNKMIQTIKAHKKDPSKIDTVTDVIGESVQDRVKEIVRINKNAGKRVGRESKRLKGKTVDFESSADDFFNILEDDLRIKFDDNLKPDFSSSPIDVNPAAKKGIVDATKKIRQVYESGDALALHDLKKTIDELVTYGAGGDGVKGAAEVKLKAFRNKIGTTLNEKFKDYGKANSDYADTITAIDDIQALAGKKTDLTGDFTKAKLGKISSRMLTDYPSKGELLKSLQGLETVGKKHGVQFNDDIARLVMIADELESRFKVEPSRSFAGRVKKGVDAAEVAIEPVQAIARKGLKKVTEILTPGDEQAMQAFEAMLKQGESK